MACETCFIRFSLFKRKKQCADCLRYFCGNCVTRRTDRVLNCDNCNTLARRPLIRSQVLQMRSRYLRQYLVAKKVSLRGCIEKEDLVNLLINYATGHEDRRTIGRPQNTQQNPGNHRESHFYGEPTRSSETPDDSPSRRSRSPQNSGRPVQTSEPSDPPPAIVQLSEVKKLSELESLSVKQLKDLLRANRVDYKGCVERCELLDRAVRLWSDHHKGREDLENCDISALCKICLDAPIECVILECGHMACCLNCGKQMSECPLCRQFVVRVVRFFKA